MKPGPSASGLHWSLYVAAACCLYLVQACSATPQTPQDTGATPAAPGSFPPEIAATLTAWPTHPPVVTRAPTVTPIPYALWTLGPSSLEPPAPPSDATPAAPGERLSSQPPAARIVIPLLGLDVPVVEVSWTAVQGEAGWHTEWETADHAAGHLRGTANPGEIGNMVIAGHHNTRGEVFRPLSDVGMPGNPLQLGAIVTVVAQDGREYHYEVTLWDRFLEKGASLAEIRQHARYMEPTATATLTLVTCWPYQGNTHRVVIVAEMVP